jgi:hypothetical protein
MDLQELAMLNPSHLCFMPRIYTSEELHNTSTNPAFFGTAQNADGSNIEYPVILDTYKMWAFS